MIILSLFIFGNVLQLLASLTYVRNTLLGRSSPNRVTFLLWALIPIIAVVAGFAGGARWSLLPIFMAGFGPLLIFLSSFVNKSAYWKLTALDYFCGALSIVAIVLWIITKEAFLAMALSILADGLALIPTLRKAWQSPETETGVGYIASFVNVCIGLGIAFFYDHRVAGVAFLVYLFIADAVLVMAVYRHNPLERLRAEFAR